MNLHRADPVRNDAAGVGVEGRGRNIGVPQIVAGERNKAVEARGLAGGHDVAGQVAATRCLRRAAVTTIAVAAAISGGMGDAGTGCEHQREGEERKEDREKTSGLSRGSASYNDCARPESD